MPTKRIGDIPQFRICNHPEHNPPSMMVYRPGRYVHTCPACGHKTYFNVYPTHCGSDKGRVWIHRRDHLDAIKKLGSVLSRSLYG